MGTVVVLTAAAAAAAAAAVALATACMPVKHASSALNMMYSLVCVRAHTHAPSRVVCTHCVLETRVVWTHGVLETRVDHHTPLLLFLLPALPPLIYTPAARNAAVISTVVVLEGTVILFC